MGNKESSQPKLGDEDHDKKNSQSQAIEEKPPVCVTKADAAKKVLDSLHNWEGIAKDASLPTEGWSPQKQLAQLQNGIFLNQKRQKYWVDKMGKNCFMLYARDFHIVWGDNDEHWRWTQLDTTSEEGVEVAELFKVSWLEVRGGFDLKKLSRETFYEVSFVVKMIEDSYGFQCYPVNLTLNLPDGSRHESKVDLSKLQPREQWVDIPMGKFRTVPGNPGEMRISMFEYCQLWKKGLVIKGVKIQPKM